MACVRLFTLYLCFLRQGLHFASSWWLHLLYSSWMNRQTILISHQKKCLRSETRFSFYTIIIFYDLAVPLFYLWYGLRKFSSSSPNSFLHAWQEAISEYTGTVITVSHDRYFIKQIVNRVIEVKDQTIQDYQGDYNVSCPTVLYFPQLWFSDLWFQREWNMLNSLHITVQLNIHYIHQ